MSQKNPKQKPSKKGFSIGRLFQSNRFVLIFSLFAAIVLWFIMAVNNTENRARIIYDIPIDTALSEEAVQQGFQVFEQSDQTARVSVTGSNLVVNQLTSSDIRVSAALSSSITRAGTYTLNLTASKSSSLTDYEVDTIYPGSIILFVDKFVEKTFSIDQQVEYTVSDGYYAASPSLSETKITISGPETEVSNVDRVVLEKKVDGQLKEPVEFEQALTLYDKNGEKITDLGHMELSSQSVNVKIDVLKKVEVPVKATFKNLPEGLDVSDLVKVSPATIKVGCYVKSKQETLKEINLQPVDMTEVTPDNTTFTVGFDLPEGCTNISGAKHAMLQFALSGYEMRTFTITNLVTSNATTGQNVSVETTELEVVLVGPKDRLQKLKNADLYAELDLDGKDELTGSIAVPAKIHVDSKYGAWAVGEYTAYVNITHTEA
ncbi:MAG: CdaR family protein [Oscillospiraceae bacterium]|nr:CdaR family protein [Oscillospiraceae bacterium]